MSREAIIENINDKKLCKLLPITFVFLYNRRSLEDMTNCKTTVLQDIPECKEGEADEKTKSSSNIRDQGDETVTVHLSN